MFAVWRGGDGGDDFIAVGRYALIGCGLVSRIGDMERYEAVGAAFAGRVGCVFAGIAGVTKLWAGIVLKKRILGGITKIKARSGQNERATVPAQQNMKQTVRRVAVCRKQVL